MTGRTPADGHDAGHDIEDGLPHERTALAWTRTALSLVVAGSLLIRYLGAPFSDVYHLPAYSALAAGTAILWLSARDQRLQTRHNESTSQLRPGRALVVGITAFGLGVASLLIVAAGR